MHSFVILASGLIASAVALSVPPRTDISITAGSLGAIPPGFKVLPEVQQAAIPPTAVYMNGIAALVTLAKEDFRGYQDQGIFSDDNFPSVQIAVFAEPKSLMKLPRAFVVWGVYQAILDMSIRRVWKDTAFRLQYDGKVIGELDIGPALRPRIGDLVPTAGFTSIDLTATEAEGVSGPKDVLPTAVMQAIALENATSTWQVVPARAEPSEVEWRRWNPASGNVSTIPLEAADITYNVAFDGAVIAPPTRVFFTIMEGLASAGLADQAKVQELVPDNLAFESVSQNCWMHFVRVKSPAPPAGGPQWTWEYALQAMRAMPQLMLEQRKFQEMTLRVMVDTIPVGLVYINVGRMPRPGTSVATA